MQHAINACSTRQKEQISIVSSFYSRRLHSALIFIVIFVHNTLHDELVIYVDVHNTVIYNDQSMYI